LSTEEEIEPYSDIMILKLGESVHKYHVLIVGIHDGKWERLGFRAFRKYNSTESKLSGINIPLRSAKNIAWQKQIVRLS
jgi:hypothetical protein